MGIGGIAAGELFCAKLLLLEGIDSCPGSRLLRNGGTNDWLQRPEVGSHLRDRIHLPRHHRAFDDPLFQQRELLSRQRIALWGHDLILVVGLDEFDQVALARIARYDAFEARIAPDEHHRPLIDAKL